MDEQQELGLDPYAALRGGIKAPMSEEEWRKRLEMMRQLGLQEDGMMMRGAEWRRGLAGKREAFRDETRDSIRQALGFKGSEATGALGAAAGAGQVASKSSL